MSEFPCRQCGNTMEDPGFCTSCGLWNEPPKTTESPTGEETAGPSEGFETFNLGESPPATGPETTEEPVEEVPVVVPRSEITCPSCGSTNREGNRHCELCGARLSQGPLPVAPRPAVQATAGVRALMAISAITLTVVGITIIFNLITGNGDDSATPDTSSTTSVVTTSTTVPPTEQNILSVDCNPPGLSSFRCENLINDREGEWQINWEALEVDQDVVIKMLFSSPIAIRQIIWENLPEGDRFYQNHRTRSITAKAASDPEYPLTLNDEPGRQILDYGVLRTNDLTITITDAYPAQIRNNRIFTELAIEGISILGRTSVTPTSALTTSTTEDG